MENWNFPDASSTVTSTIHYLVTIDIHPVRGSVPWRSGSTPIPDDVVDGDSAFIGMSSSTPLPNGTAGDPGWQSFVKPWPALKQPLPIVLLIGFAYLAVAILGVVNNTLVVMVICRQEKMKTVTNVFLANLAIADVLVCVFVLPITLLQNILTEWWYGWAVCKIVAYLQGVSVGASVNTLAAVALERYLEIYHPRTTKLSMGKAKLLIIVIWLLPVLVFIPWLMVYREKVYVINGFEFVACHADWQRIDLQKAYTVIVVFLTCYLVPLAFIGICYLLIGIKVWKRRICMPVASRAGRNISRSKTRTLKMLVVVVLVFAIFWLPLYCISLQLLFDQGLSDWYKKALKRYFIPFAQWLGAANSCANPFVYCCYSYSFRNAVRGMLERQRSATIRRRLL